MQQYLNLLTAIKMNGTVKPPARQNMPFTKGLFGYQIRCNLQEGFPLLTTKKINFKHILTELMWFLRGDTNIKYLVDHNVNIWKEDAYQYYCKLLKNDGVSNADTMSLDEFKDVVSRNEHSEFVLESFDHVKPENYEYGDCGYQYGRVWRNWKHEEKNIFFGWLGEKSNSHVDQIKNLINSLQNTPESRRHIISAIDPAHDTELALYWCHCMAQFNCRPLSFEQRFELLNSFQLQKVDKLNKMEGLPEESNAHIVIYMNERMIPKYYLDCQMYQRSCDVFLGVPYNIASYALLTHILAKICNMIVGDYVHTFGDVHIYQNHVPQVEEQLKRTPTKLPTLTINDKFWNPNRHEDDIYSRLGSGTSEDLTLFFSSIHFDNFQLVGYEPQAFIKGDLSTGLSK